MRKSIFKFVATAAAVSMIATAASAVMVNAEDATYENYTYRLEDNNAIITGYTDSTVTSLDVISEIKDGDNTYSVVGIDDLAFSNLDNITSVTLPASLQEGKISDIAFVTKKNIEKFINEELGSEPTEADAIAYIAKAVKYAGKTEGWTEEELAAVKEKTVNAMVKAGIPAADITADKINADMVLVVLKNTDKLGITASSIAAIDEWADTVKIYDTKITAPEGSDAAKWIEKIEGKMGASYLRGDANHDDKVNVRDCAYIARELAKMGDEKTISYETNPAADYNLDKTVNIRDAAALARDLANKTVQS